MSPPFVAVQSPIRSAMFDASGNVTLPWIYFFQRLTALLNAAGGSVLTQRTLVLGNLAVGAEIADPVAVHPAGTVALVVGLLRQAIAADLTVTLNVVTATTSIVVGTFTIPAATAINTVVQFTSFAAPDLADLDVLAWTVLASDGSSDLNPIASFTAWWGMSQ